MESNKIKAYLKPATVLFCLIALMAACKEASKPITEELNQEEIPVPVSIKNTTLPVIEYVKWIQNPVNGFKKMKVMDDLLFTVQYKPADYMVCIEERTGSISDTLLRRKQEELAGIQYYDLKILLKDNEGELLKHGLSSTDEYAKRVSYFSFDMQRDIQLVEGKDTLPCVVYHFERTYDVAPFCTLLIGFESKEGSTNKQKTVLMYDKLFNKGLLKFTFKENKLQYLPKLQTI